MTADPEITIAGGQATIRCATEGASIAYRVGKDLPSGEGGRWLLYSAPFPVAAGQTVQTKACRLGYRDSQIVNRTSSSNLLSIFNER